MELETQLSPLVQGRGLKRVWWQLVDTQQGSPLVQGRGLKQKINLRTDIAPMSPLVQGRGLKHFIIAFRANCFGVAPRAGAWIETHRRQNFIPRQNVAPRAGAWIETSFSILEC